MPAAGGGAEIGYTHHGYVSGSDSVNFFGAHYEATGRDEQRLIDTVDAMFFAVAESADRPARSVDVTVQLAGDTLTLITGDTALTLARDGEQPELSTMTEATPTATG